MEVSEGSPGKN